MIAHAVLHSIEQCCANIVTHVLYTHCRELVDRIDTDGNKGLSVEEMVDWMVRIEKAQTTKSLRNHFRETDRNSNGYVTLTEFAHTMANTGETIPLVLVPAVVHQVSHTSYSASG